MLKPIVPLPTLNTPLTQLSAEVLAVTLPRFMRGHEFLPSKAESYLRMAYVRTLTEWQKDKGNKTLALRVWLFWIVTVTPTINTSGQRVPAHISIITACKHILNNNWDVFNIAYFAHRSTFSIGPKLTASKETEKKYARITREFLKGSSGKAYALLTNRGMMNSSGLAFDMLRNSHSTGQSEGEYVTDEIRELRREKNPPTIMPDDAEPEESEIFEKFLSDDLIANITLKPEEVLRVISKNKLSTHTLDGCLSSYFQFLIPQGELSPQQQELVDVLTDFLNAYSAQELDPSVIMLMNTSKLFAIGEKKLRPITQQCMLFKMLSKAFFIQKAGVLSGRFGNTQLVNEKAGIEKAIHSLNLYIDRNPYSDIILIDGKSAFSIVDRHSIVTEMAKSDPEAAKFLSISLQLSVPSVWADVSKDVANGPQLFRASVGIPMGSSTSSTAFSMGIQPVVEKLEDKYKEVAKEIALNQGPDSVPGETIVLAFCDDIAVGGPMEAHKPAIDEISTTRTREMHGYFTNPAKTIVLMGKRHSLEDAKRDAEIFIGLGINSMNIKIHPETVPDGPEFDQIRTEAQARGGVLYLGTPIGSAEFKNEWLKKHLETLRCEAIDLANFSNAQIKTHLFLDCWNNKVQHLARTLPPDMLATYLALFEELKRTTLATAILGMKPEQLSDLAFDQCRLNRGDGGLGCTNTLDMSPAAFLASICDSVDFIEAKFPGTKEEIRNLSSILNRDHILPMYRKILKALEMLNQKAGLENHFTSDKLLDPAFWEAKEEKLKKDPHLPDRRHPTKQTLLQIEIRLRQVATLVDKLDPCSAHRLAAYSDPNTGMNWLRARHTLKDDRNAVGNDAWTIGLLTYIGSPLMGQGRPFGTLGRKCRCGVLFSSDPMDHLLSTNCFSGKTEVHNSTRDKVAETFNGIGKKTAREVLNGANHDADIQINDQIAGLGPHARTAIDTSHPHPTVPAMQNRTSKQIYYDYGLALVSKTYNSKCRQEVVDRLAACQVNARPLVIGTHGEIEPRSLSLIKCIAASASGYGYWKDKTTALTRHILTAITLNLFRAKATMLIRVMREIYPNQFFSFEPDTGLIESVYTQCKVTIAEAALNEPYLRLRIPRVNVPNNYLP